MVFGTEEGTGAGRRRRNWGMGESGGAAELKHEEKKELRQSALSESDARVEPLAESNGIEEDVRRMDFTYDQNLDGGHERE